MMGSMVIGVGVVFLTVGEARKHRPDLSRPFVTSVELDLPYCDCDVVLGIYHPILGRQLLMHGRVTGVASFDEAGTSLFGLGDEGRQKLEADLAALRC